MIAGDGYGVGELIDEGMIVEESTGAYVVAGIGRGMIGSTVGLPEGKFRARDGG